MRGFGTLLFVSFIIFCGLSVSGIALQKFGASDQMVAEFIQKEGWGAGTRWNVDKQYYAASILRVGRALPRAGKQDFGGEASARLLLVGGVPVKLYDAGGYGLERAGTQEDR